MDDFSPEDCRDWSAYEDYLADALRSGASEKEAHEFAREMSSAPVDAGWS